MAQVSASNSCKEQVQKPLEGDSLVIVEAFKGAAVRTCTSRIYAQGSGVAQFIGMHRLKHPDSA